MSDNMLGRIVKKLAQLPAEMLGPLFDLLEKLTGASSRKWLIALNKFLRGEQPWGIPFIFSITTNYRSGDQCHTDLEKNGYRIEGCARQLLHDKKFVATNGVIYTLTMILGDDFDDFDRSSNNIRTRAYKRGYIDPPVELSPYIREIFSDEDLEQSGLWSLVIMHEPILNSIGGLFLLGISRRGAGRLLVSCKGHTSSRWDREVGFVFLVTASSNTEVSNSKQ